MQWKAKIALSRILKHFASEIAILLTESINAAITQGCWPDILKREIVTPVPKIYLPKEIDDLRNSNLKSRCEKHKAFSVSFSQIQRRICS